MTDLSGKHLLDQERIPVLVRRVSDSADHRYGLCKPLSFSTQILDGGRVHIEGNQILYELTPSRTP